MEFWRKYKIEILIFFSALAIRLVFFVLTLVKTGEPGFLYYGDSEGYLNLAKNLVLHGVFSQESASPYAPDLFRTPIYPIFIIPFYFLFKSVAMVILAQNIISALTAVLVYKMGKIIFSEKVGLAAGIFFAVEPHIAYWSNELLSETLFVFLFVTSLFLFIKFTLNYRWSVLSISAVVLGLATLTRPISVLTPIIFSLFLFIFLRKTVPFKKILMMAIIFLIISFSVLTPWLLRNVITFKIFSLTNQGSVVICDINTNTYLSFREAEIGGLETQKLRENITQDVRGLPSEDLFLRHQTQFCKRILRILQVDPVGYIKVYFRSFVPFFWGDGYLTMLHKFFPSYFKIPSTSLWAQIPRIGKVDWNGFLGGYNKFEFIIFLLGKLIWVSVSFFALLAIIFAWRDPLKRNYVLLFYLLMLYFVTASGFIAYSRHRQPINPILIITAFYGFLGTIERLRRLRFKSIK
jgi:4-amino-4-deoxy-L-arabinose transferase-like glycosyltransferase